MKKSLFLLLGASMFALASCNKTEKKETETTTATENKGNTDYEAAYRKRAKHVTKQMSSDLYFDMDTAMQNKVSNIYYNRAKRRHETRSKYSTDTTGMYSEMRDIDLETDKEFQKILKPKQYEMYETRRTTYYGGFEETDMPSPGYDTATSASGTSMDTSSQGMSNTNTSTNTNTNTSNARVRTKTEKDGDTKTEIEDKNSETKIKTKKGGDTKVKVHQKH